MLIDRKDREKKTHTSADSSPRHHVHACGSHHGERPTRSPSPSCYRRRSPAPGALTEEGAAGGRRRICESSPNLNVRPPVQAGNPGSPASPRHRTRSRERHEDSLKLSRRTGHLQLFSTSFSFMASIRRPVSKKRSTRNPKLSRVSVFGRPYSRSRLCTVSCPSVVCL